jgi:hypothetical protein
VVSEAIAAVSTAASAAFAAGSARIAVDALESALACTAEAAGAAVAVADMLAAMAAAAIANGAVALPEVGALPDVAGAAGATVTATVTGIAVAMAFVTVAASCGVEAVGPVEELAPAVSSDDDFAVDFAVSDFELPDFVRECRAGPALVSELALVSEFAEAP